MVLVYIIASVAVVLYHQLLDTPHEVPLYIKD
jgi:hypothetical protein